MHTEPELHPIGYARVSRQDQDLGLQLTAFAKEGIRAEDIYRETVSGAKKKRPEFERMMRELRPGDVVTVWKLDRLSRSLTSMLETVEEIHRKGAKLRVITQQIDTTTASGRMFLQMLGVIAEFERALISERTSAGLERSRAEGRVGGRRQSFTEQQVRDALALRRSGKSWLAAAKSIGISVTRLQARVRELCQTTN
jgi:DNA invertase Pin-like site-specific DNA recombinase